MPHLITSGDEDYIRHCVAAGLPFTAFTAFMAFTAFIGFMVFMIFMTFRAFSAFKAFLTCMDFIAFMAFTASVLRAAEACVPPLGTAAPCTVTVTLPTEGPGVSSVSV